MKIKILLSITFTAISGCSATYSESAKNILEPSTQNCSSVELYNPENPDQNGYQIMQNCIETLVAQNVKPKNLKTGQREIWQCLSKKGFSILETCK